MSAAMLAAPANPVHPLVELDALSVQLAGCIAGCCEGER